MKRQAKPRFPDNSYVRSDFNQLPDEEKRPGRTLKSIVYDAKKTNDWLYDPLYRHWYSPEEYMDLKERITVGLQPELDRIEIKSPLDRISHGFDYIKEFKELDKLDKFKEFVMKVVQYYRSSKTISTKKG